MIDVRLITIAYTCPVAAVVLLLGCLPLGLCMMDLDLDLLQDKPAM